MVVHTHNPSTQAGKAQRSWLQKQPELHNKFRASLSYRARSEVKKTKDQNDSNKNNFVLSIPTTIAINKILKDNSDSFDASASSLN